MLANILKLGLILGNSTIRKYKCFLKIFIGIFQEFFQGDSI